MKLLTKEEEQAHYNATLKGGILGCLGGLAVGVVGVYGATKRYPSFNQLTLPLKAFLVTSSGTFAGIISADHWSRAYEQERNVDQRFLQSREHELQAAESRGKTFTQRAYDFAKKEKYKIIGGSWVGSIILSFILVGRNPYLTGQQKLVQARVYAQGLTLAVMCAAAAVEIKDKNKGEGRWETIKYIDPNDPEHKHLIEKKVHKERYEGEDLWRDMVEAEEERLSERDAAIKKQEAEDRKKHNKKGKLPIEKSSPKVGKESHTTEDGTEMEQPVGNIPGKKGEGKKMRDARDQPAGAESSVP